eukprot:RCo013478
MEDFNFTTELRRPKPPSRLSTRYSPLLPQSLRGPDPSKLKPNSYLDPTFNSYHAAVSARNPSEAATERYAGHADEYLKRTLRNDFSLAATNFVQNFPEPLDPPQERWVPNGQVRHAEPHELQRVEESIEALKLASEVLRNNKETFSTFLHREFARTPVATPEDAAVTLLRCLDNRE